MFKVHMIAIAFFVMAFLVLLHQFVFYGYWWEPTHVIGLHHESIALVLICIGFVIIIGWNVSTLLGEE